MNKIKAISKNDKGGNLEIEIIGTNKVVIARILVASSYPYEYNMDVYPVVYPHPDKRQNSSCLKLDVKGHGYKLTRKVSKECICGKLKPKWEHIHCALNQERSQVDARDVEGHGLEIA